MKQFNEAKFIIDNEEHTIKVNSIGNDSVNLIIQSNPIQIDIKIGEEKKFDLNDDGIYDLYVKLNGVNNDVPEIYVKRIHEIIPTEKNLEKSSNSETKNNTVDSTDSEKSGTSEINNNSSKESSTLETNNSDFSINNNTNEEIEKNSLFIIFPYICNICF